MNEHKKHCLLKYLGLVLATILGAFLAFYFVLNTTINHFMSPYYAMNQMDKMIERENKEFNNDFLKEDMPVFGLNKEQYKHHEIITLMRTPEAYKFIIDLKPFHGNVNAINIETKNGQITINGEVSTNKKHEKSLAKISQTYLLENGVNYNKISKKKIDNNYIITVPIEDD